MKQLIISDYDSSCEFTYVVLNNGIEIERSENVRDMVKYGLYDENWNMLDPIIDLKKNKLIQEFDMIICCVDGNIEIYRKK